MMVRTQLSLTLEQHRKARKRAEELGISLAEYVRRLVDADLNNLARAADVSAIFDLGRSGDSDIARHKDEYIGEAVEAEYHSESRPSGRR
ncbi:MAG: hypothetical protein DLM67_23730 [Candidatus Nephthysia bennettiae]|uniref:Ribbon-helix-helix protein, CopG family n=1 Tax=Candidatus Nephthysia bennettiae TaxID=3127016 RepID=A0A934NE95_9BACT|nr:hypothetical protein [Candidatus Dormibacteraeota bacterium]MBJ7612911.1 hypothetical protein [Candidatus Dormibacteraeota bacterium]PZR86556.1 MAG: hypothetical protein DLM67_23730 [Candidatus Dormibacteraeota bacterium]